VLAGWFSKTTAETDGQKPDATEDRKQAVESDVLARSASKGPQAATKDRKQADQADTLARSASKGPQAATKDRKQADQADQPRSSAGDAEIGLKMSPAVVCRSIDGFEAYESLPGAKLTSDEKLLVYYRPEGFKTSLAKGLYQAHFTQDAQIRKRGEKAVLRQKKNLLDYNPKTSFPPQNIYLRNSISLKGLSPGDYDLTIILRDEIAKCPAATQVVKFRVIPAQDPRKASDATAPIDHKKSPKDG
jgi:hypothetical protein